MFAVVVINIEAPLRGSFHYFVPNDLRDVLAVGHLVEVEFGRRLAQGIVISFDSEAPVADNGANIWTRGYKRTGREPP